VHRRARAIPDAAIDEGLVILNNVIDQGEEASLRGFWRARAVEKDESRVASIALPTAEDGLRAEG
jgi:hypothetical protein